MGFSRLQGGGVGGEHGHAGGGFAGFFRRQCFPFPRQRLWRLRKPAETDARDRCYLIWSKNMERVKHLEVLSSALGWGHAGGELEPSIT